MKQNALFWRMSSAVLGTLVLLFTNNLQAQKLWTSPTNGLWREGTNWSGGTAPSITNIGNVLIGNANTKVVTIDSGTSSSNLTVGRLNLWGTNNGNNTLLMDNVTTNKPLILGSQLTIGKGGAFDLINSAVQVSDSLTISNGGSLNLTNASLMMNASLGMFFNLYGGSATLDSGFIKIGDTNVHVRVGRSTSATLSIHGGDMQVGGHMILGDSGFNNSQGTLNMTGGTLALNSFLSLGEGMTGSTGIVFMTGGQLTVTNSGTNGFIRVGNLGKGQMVVSNAVVNLSSELSIGDNSASSGVVSLSDGAQLTVATNSTNIVRIGNYGAGQMIVSNASLLLPDTSVGRHTGANGTLLLQSNALAVITDDLSIGRFSGATGAVFMAGGQLLVTNDNTSIWVGREGMGQMTISNGNVLCRGMLVAAVATNTASGLLTVSGGQMLVASNFVVGDAGLSTGRVSMAGGIVNVTNQSAGAVLECAVGTMTFSGGNLITDELRLTNNAGRFTFNGGTLASRNTTVSNSFPFVVGDGTNPATFQLLGGTHTFANGLVISPNATLSGCGTIIGTIVNQGTIATNCGGSTPPLPSITQEPTSQTVAQGATASFSVVANNALQYQWRFSGIMGNLPGATDPTLVVPNAQGTNAGNYRVVVSNNSGSVTSMIATLRVLIPTALTNTSLIGTNLSFLFSTVNGLNYTVEYKTNLNDLSWIPLSTIPGIGAAINFSNIVSAIPSRFYRIHVQ
jgi:T5SS/PEP-CTERM-associated repeat protein